MEKFRELKISLANFPHEYLTAHRILEKFFTTCETRSPQPWNSLEFRDRDKAKTAIFAVWNSDSQDLQSWQLVLKKILEDAINSAEEQSITTREVIKANFLYFFYYKRLDDKMMLSFADVVAEVMFNHNKKLFTIAE